MPGLGKAKVSDMIDRPVAPHGDRLTFGRSPLYLTGLPDDVTFRPVVPEGRPPVYLFPSMVPSAGKPGEG